MTTPMSELNPNSVSRSDRERFRDILAVQRAAYLRGMCSPHPVGTHLTDGGGSVRNYDDVVVRRSSGYVTAPGCAIAA
jgi:hypothetical protein